MPGGMFHPIAVWYNTEPVFNSNTITLTRSKKWAELHQFEKFFGSKWQNSNLHKCRMACWEHVASRKWNRYYWNWAKVRTCRYLGGLWSQSCWRALLRHFSSSCFIQTCNLPLLEGVLTHDHLENAVEIDYEPRQWVIGNVPIEVIRIPSVTFGKYTRPLIIADGVEIIANVITIDEDGYVV